MAKTEQKSQKSLADRESSLQPVSKKEPISDRDLNLVQEAHEAKILLENFDQEYTNSKIRFVYVISSKWLTRWKQYTSYDNVTQGKSPDEKYFGQDILPKINQDIVVGNDHIIKHIYKDDYRNVVLRGGLEENKDYELITETAWNYFAERYEHITVKRPVHVLSDGKKVVEVMFKQFRIVHLNKRLFDLIFHGHMLQFKADSFQASAFTTISYFKYDLINTLDFECIGLNDDRVRLFLLDPALDLRSSFNEIKNGIYSRYGTRIIQFKGNYLEKDSSLKLGEISLSDEDIIFLDSREPDREWTFFGDGADIITRCDYCNTVQELNIACDGCNKIFYCCEECKVKDRRFHTHRCGE